MRGVLVNTPDPQQDMVTVTWEERMSPYFAALRSLVGKTGVRFESRTLKAVPQAGGVCMFSALEGPHVCYYVGMSPQDIQYRLQLHWSNYTQSDLSRRIVEAGKSRDREGARRWISRNVVVRWLLSDETPMQDAYLEHFLIAVLQPEFNWPRKRTRS